MVVQGMPHGFHAFHNLKVARDEMVDTAEGLKWLLSLWTSTSRASYSSVTDLSVNKLFASLEVRFMCHKVTAFDPSAYLQQTWIKPPTRTVIRGRLLRPLRTLVWHIERRNIYQAQWLRFQRFKIVKGHKAQNIMALYSLVFGGLALQVLKRVKWPLDSCFRPK